VGFSLSGCAKKESEQQASSAADAPSQAQTEAPQGMMPPAEVTSKPGTAAVPESTQPVPVEGLFVSPYFDAAGTKSEITLEPGDRFSTYVFAETVEPYRTNGTCFRLQMPPGIRVVGTGEHPERRLTFGTWDFCYMITYECKPPGRYLAVTYFCMVEPGFQGGKIQALPGFMANDLTFIGFSTCEDFTELWANGGTATLTLK
jgi:hypothetical protein